MTNKMLIVSMLAAAILACAWLSMAQEPVAPGSSTASAGTTESPGPAQAAAVAALDDDGGVVRADRREHGRPALAGAEDLPGVHPRRRAGIVRVLCAHIVLWLQAPRVGAAMRPFSYTP